MEASAKHQRVARGQKRTPSFAKLTESAARRRSNACTHSHPPTPPAHHIKGTVASPLAPRSADLLRSAVKSDRTRLNEEVFEQRLRDTICAIRSSLEESLNDEVAETLSMRSHHDRMRNVFCGLDAFLESTERAQQKDMSPCPRVPSGVLLEAAQRANRASSTSISDSQNGLSPEAAHSSGLVTPPPSPQKHLSTSPRLVSPIRLQVLGSLLPSPAKPSAEGIDYSSSSSETSTTSSETISDAPRRTMRHQHCDPTLQAAPFDERSELKEFLVWCGRPKDCREVPTSRYSALFPHVPLQPGALHHTSDPPLFIRWIAQANVFGALTSGDPTLLQAILDAAVDEATQDLTRDIVIEALLS